MCVGLGTLAVLAGLVLTGLVLGGSARAAACTPNFPYASIAPSTLPGGQIGEPYSQSLSVTDLYGCDDHMPPYSFQLMQGQLPAGLRLSDGRLVGTPTTAGRYSFTVEALDANGISSGLIDYVVVAAEPDPPDTAIQSVVCTYHPPGGTRCRDTDGNGGETTTLTYSISNADSAQYLLHYDGVADEWRPLGPSPDEVWFDSVPNCDPQTLQVRARRSSDGAVDPTPATVQLVVEPFGGCAEQPYAANSFEGNLLDALTTWPFYTVPSFDPLLFLPVSGASGQGLGEVVTPLSPGPNPNSQSTATAVPASVAHGYEGDDTWYRVRMRFPVGDYHPAPQDWNWTVEWHNDSHTAGYGYKSPALGVYTDSAGDNPRFHFRPWGGVGSAPTIEHWYTGANSLRVDHWYDLVFHIVWDTHAVGDGGSGLIEFWVDGRPFDGHLGCSTCPTVWSNPHPFPTLTTNPDGTVSHQANALYNYRQAIWPLGVLSSRIDYDEWLIGPTAGSVGFTP